MVHRAMLNQQLLHLHMAAFAGVCEWALVVRTHVFVLSGGRQIHVCALGNQVFDDVDAVIAGRHHHQGFAIGFQALVVQIHFGHEAVDFFHYFDVFAQYRRLEHVVHVALVGGL